MEDRWGEMRRGGSKSTQQCLYVFEHPFQGDRATWGREEPYGGHPHGPEGNEEEQGTWEEINGPGGWDGPVLDSVIPVAARGWGR